MIIIFWILSIFLLSGFTYFLIRILILRYNKIHKRWGRVITDNLIIKEKTFQISEEIAVRGWIYGSTDFIEYDHKMPGIIIIPRRDKKYPFFEHWGAHFALQGYPALCIEVYDKKLSQRTFVEKYRPILRKIKQEFIQDNSVDPNKIIYFGCEDSAKLAVLEGIEEEEVKIVCGISMPKIEAEEIQKDRGDTDIYLIHCEDDKVVPITDFEHNRKILKIGPHDFIVYKLGGHNIIGQEPASSAFFSIKVKQKLKPIYKQIIKREFA